MQLSGYYRYWGCNITVVDYMKDFLYTGILYNLGEAIQNHEDEFRASSSFSGFIVFTIYFRLPIIMGC